MSNMHFYKRHSIDRLHFQTIAVRTVFLVLFITAMSNIYPLKSKDTSTNCLSRIQGVYDFNDYGIHLLILTGTHEIYFRTYPTHYSVNKATWIKDCMFRLETINIHDDPELSNETLGDIWFSDYYKIKGNKVYYQNYDMNREPTNRGFIIKKTSVIPEEFKFMQNISQ